jgi:hypothetical protein
VNLSSLRTRRGRTVGVGIAALVVGGLTFGAVGLASAGTVASPTRFGPQAGIDAHGNIHQCIVSGFVKPNTTLVDAKGPKGAICYTIAKGTQGPAGPAGASAVVTVSGTTNVTAWPESSGWANDAFTRTLTLTRDHQVDNSNCNGAPECFEYFGTLVDNGSFTTVDGKTGPNGTDTISGVHVGTMQGVAKFSFYSDSGAPNGALVPAAASGASKPATTSTWYTLALPASAHVFGGKLTAYSWTYNSAATCEQWVDAINPGDDGQSAADGNILGISKCTS